jgi:hypothetical protein
VAVLLAVVAGARAQAIPPRIGYVYPAGGRQGDTFEVMVGGQSLDAAGEAYVDGGGIQATMLEYIKPLTPAQAGQLRERIQELQQKPRDAAVTDEIAQIRAKLFAFANRPGPAIAETVKLRIAIAANASLNQHELRLKTPAGLSNPLVFCVGQLPELSAKTAGIIDPSDFKGPRLLGQPSTTPQREMAVTLPAVVNGQIMPGGVDRYRFQARKGQRLVAAVNARELIPYLADAVPGWFQAALTLYDADGNALAYADHFQFHPDPVLYSEIPKDGQYVLAIQDSLYRGRQDFVYRITLGELPYLAGIFPLGGQAGQPATVELSGWNLLQTKLELDAKDNILGLRLLGTRNGEWLSNLTPFESGDLPECVAKKTAHSAETAQAVTLPVVVNGRIEQPGQWDVFRFDGRAGQEIVAQVDARRLGSALDSVLRLTDANGRELAFNDDHEDKELGLVTHQADSYIRCRLPADGTYYLHLGDAQRQGGSQCAYRLRISTPRPDFALRLAPSSLNVRPGASVVCTAYVLRKDGFAGAIDLSLKDAPTGFTLAGGRVPENQDTVPITLTAPTSPTQEPVSLTIQGRAKIQGVDVVRTAVPAEDMMQAFAYRHLVAAKGLYVDVAGRYMPRATGGIISSLPVKLPAGGAARVQTAVSTSTLAGTIGFELDQPPEGIAIQSVSSIARGTEIMLKADAAKVKPGLKGNLIVSMFLTPRPTTSATSRPQTNSRRMLVGVLPAIPFEIASEGQASSRPADGPGAK